MIGLIIFLLSIPIPQVLETSLDYISGLNTPVAMIIIGIYIAQTDFKKALRNPHVYFVSAMKLLVIPLIIIVIHKLIHTPEEIMIANTLATACPVAAACSMFVAKFGGDGIYGASLVTITTVLSILTIPLMAIVMRAF